MQNMPVLEKIKKAYLSNENQKINSIRSDLFMLADNPDPEATKFFAEFLSSNNQMIVESALNYFSSVKLKKSDNATLAIKKIVKSTEMYSETLRMRAVSVLGRTLTSLDDVLTETMLTDPELMIRATAFGAVVEIQTDFWTGQEAFEKADSGELEPTLENADKIVAEWNAKNDQKS
jgi:hypothetical protein